MECEKKASLVHTQLSSILAPTAQVYLDCFLWQISGGRVSQTGWVVEGATAIQLILSERTEVCHVEFWGRHITKSNLKSAVKSMVESIVKSVPKLAKVEVTNIYTI
jgi:hypothetical protein